MDPIEEQSLLTANSLDSIESDKFSDLESAQQPKPNAHVKVEHDHDPTKKISPQPPLVDLVPDVYDEWPKSLRT